MQRLARSLAARQQSLCYNPHLLYVSSFDMPSKPKSADDTRTNIPSLKHPPLFVLGVTGGIGSGKSTVSHMLKSNGAEVLEADMLGRQLLQPAGGAVAELLQHFGPQVDDGKGGIDAAQLAKLAFSSPQQVAKLNAISHPRIRQAIQQRLKQLQTEKAAAFSPYPVVIEAALLLEANWDFLCDSIWVVFAPIDIACQRAEQQGRLSAEDIQQRIRVQMPPEARLIHANTILDNSQDLPALTANVQQQWQKLSSQLKQHPCP